MKVSFTVFFLIVSFSLFGNSNYILFEKLPVNKENDTHFRFLKENEKYVDHVSTQWNYSVEKRVLIDGLKQALQHFSNLGSNNLENNLLIGDIASYLYNLGEANSFQTAENHFKYSIKSDPFDYRAFWFLACLYTNARDHENAIQYFRMAQTRLPKVEPALFWEQAASAAASACMPTNCIFAMDKARAILGKPGDFEKKSGLLVRSKLVQVNTAGNYTNNDLWTYTEGDKYIFTSRPLGMLVSVYSDWSVSISGYENKVASFTMVSPEITNKSGQEKTYTITVTAHVVSEEDDLRSFLDGMISPDSSKTEVNFSIKYSNMISYKVGANQYLIGVKRKQPKYPGLDLEKPQPTPASTNELDDFCTEKWKNRFGGVLFYSVLLDASEDIFPTAIGSFRNIFENLITFE